MKTGTKLLAIALPIALVLTVAALLGAGSVPQVGPLPDLLAYAFELAPRTMYAIAVGGATAVAMNLSGMNIENNRRCAMVEDAVQGCMGSFRVLLVESACWIAWGVLWAHVFIVWQG